MGRCGFFCDTPAVLQIGAMAAVFSHALSQTLPIHCVKGVRDHPRTQYRSLVDQVSTPEL